MTSNKKKYIRRGVRTLEKRGIAFFLFTLLVFPTVIGSFHQLEHKEDSHCAETRTHFDAIVHHCALCEMLLPTTSTPPDFNFLTVLPKIQPIYRTFPTPEFIATYNLYFSLRAPPSIV